MTLVDFNAPDFEYGGGQPARYKSNDGTYFYSGLARKASASDPLRFVVWHVDAAGGLVEPAWESSGIIGDGQLCLQGDGSLEATGYVAFGDGKMFHSVAVPNWKPWPVGGGTYTLPVRYDAALKRLCAWFGI